MNQSELFALLDEVNSAKALGDCFVPPEGSVLALCGDGFRETTVRVTNINRDWLGNILGGPDQTYVFEAEEIKPWSHTHTVSIYQPFRVISVPKHCLPFDRWHRPQRVMEWIAKAKLAHAKSQG